MRKLPLPAHNMCPSPEKNSLLSALARVLQREAYLAFRTSQTKENRSSFESPRTLPREGAGGWEGAAGAGGADQRGPGTAPLHAAGWPQGVHLAGASQGSSPVWVVWVGLGVPQVRALPKGGRVLSCHPLSSRRVCSKDIPVVGHRCPGFSDKSLAGAVLGVRLNYDAFNHTQGTQLKKPTEQ